MVLEVENINFHRQTPFTQGKLYTGEFLHRKRITQKKITQLIHKVDSPRPRQIRISPHMCASDALDLCRGLLHKLNSHFTRLCARRAQSPQRVRFRAAWLSLPPKERYVEKLRSRNLVGAQMQVDHLEVNFRVATPV